jgi:hypothetical protein
MEFLFLDNRTYVQYNDSMRRMCELIRSSYPANSLSIRQRIFVLGDSVFFVVEHAGCLPRREDATRFSRSTIDTLFMKIVFVHLCSVERISHPLTAVGVAKYSKSEPGLNGRRCWALSPARSVAEIPSVLLGAAGGVELESNSAVLLVNWVFNRTPRSVSGGVELESNRAQTPLN